jgi:hypothetical protein
VNQWLAKLKGTKNENAPTPLTDKTDITHSGGGTVSSVSKRSRPFSENQRVELPGLESENGHPDELTKLTIPTTTVASPQPAPKPISAPQRMSRAESLSLLATVEAELAGARGLLGPEPSEITRASCSSVAARIVQALGQYPRGGCSPARWQQFTADVRGFVENGWLHRAHDLGWDFLELLGADHVAPWARYDGMGLLLLLNGSKVIGLTDRVARIMAAPTGARRTYYRRVPLDRERVLLIDQIGPNN